jgi:hypothetical protein
MIVRNSATGFRILSDWAAAADDGRCEFALFNHPREQACFSTVVLPRWGDEVRVVDSPLWKGASGSWIVHWFTIFDHANLSSAVLRTWAYLLKETHASMYADLQDILRETDMNSTSSNGTVANNTNSRFERPWEEMADALIRGL